MDRVLAMTPEERENELRAAGVDVAVERAKAREWRQKATGGGPPASAEVRPPETAAMAASPDAAPLPDAIAAGAPPSNVVPLQAAPARRRLRLVMLLAAALGGVLGVVVIVGRMLESDDTVAAPYPGPSMAEELRERAFAACDAQRWDECLQGLDAARDRDPSGEQDARVREYRQRAESALKGGPPAPPR